MLAAIVETSELTLLGLSSVLKDEGYATFAVSDVSQLEQPADLDLIVTELHTENDLLLIRTRLIDADITPPCVAVVSDPFRPHVMGCASAGFSAIVHHTCRLDTLRKAIRAAASGRQFVDEYVGSWMLSAPNDRCQHAGLSEREREVAQLLLTDMTRDEIARALFVSPNTIKYHTTRIYAKLGVQSRRGLRFVLGAEVAPARSGERA